MNLIDYRCPHCNKPLRGKQDVVHRKQKPPATLKCNDCLTVVHRKESNEAGIGTSFHYE